MAGHKYFDRICAVIMAIAVVITILFMNGTSLGLMAIADQDSETYIMMGLQGFVFLAVERMILFIQSFICVSHFIIHAARRQEAIRVSLNQVSILFLLSLCNFG